MQRFKVIILTIVVLASSDVWSSLRVFPVVLEMSAKNKTAQLTIRHSYSTLRWVEVSSVFYEMNIDGSMIEKDYEESVSAKNSAIRLIRFSPKRFQLKPGEAQVLRIRAHIPSNIEDGSYRVHLKFTPDEADELASTSDEGSGIQQQLKARIAIAVPVYLYKGDKKPVVAITKPQIIDSESGSELSAFLELKGTNMVRGDFLAFAVDKNDANKKVLVGKLLGVASYRETRKVSIQLLEIFSTLRSDSSKNLELVFKASENSEETLASQTIPLVKN